MNEREILPATITVQDVSLLTEQRGSLVARGLLAFKEHKKRQLVLNSQDGRYRQARAIFDKQVCNIRKKSWTPEESAALFAAFKTFSRIAAEKYGKAYFPLAWFYSSGWQIVPKEQAAQGEAADAAGYEALKDVRQAAHYEQLAFEWCSRNRDAHDAELWFDLAACYIRGVAIEQDAELSVHWLKKAAEQGHELAQNQLGRMYETGRGSAQDDEQAVFWYRRAAEQGNGWALVGLGVMYLKGRGVEKDYQQAVYWFRKAAERGNVASQCQLAWLYRDGRGVEQDHKKSVYWFQKAAEQGDELAQYLLGGICEERPDAEQGYEQAAYWYRKAAEQNHVASQKQLGKMYRDGRGVEQDDVQAVYWFRKSAQQGNDWGQYYLGLMYQEGRGVEQDDTQALYWLCLAAEQGLEAAKEQVALMQNLARERINKPAETIALQAELFIPGAPRPLSVQRKILSRHATKKLALAEMRHMQSRIRKRVVSMRKRPARKPRRTQARSVLTRDEG